MKTEAQKWADAQKWVGEIKAQLKRNRAMSPKSTVHCLDSYIVERLLEFLQDAHATLACVRLALNAGPGDDLAVTSWEAGDALRAIGHRLGPADWDNYRDLPYLLERRLRAQTTNPEV